MRRTSRRCATPDSSTRRRGPSARRCSTPSPRSTNSRGSSTSRSSRSSRRCTTSRSSRWWRGAGSARSSRWATGSSRTAWRASSAPGTCWPASSSGAGPTSGRGGSCATRSAATWSASSTGRSPTARVSWRGALEPVGRTRVTDNVRGMIWSKLLINSTFTGLSAVSGLRYGGVAEQGPDAVFALWAEGVAVGDAQGLSLESIHDVNPHEFGPDGLATMMQPHGQRAALDAAGPRRGARHRGRRGQRRRGRQGARAWHRHAVQRRRGRARALDGARRALPEPRWLAYVSDAQTTSATDT